MANRFLIAAALLASGTLVSCSDAPQDRAPQSSPQAQLSLLRKPAPDGAGVYFVAPADGAEVTSPVTVQFGLTGMGVAPAGIDQPDTGHHHLLIDVELSDFGVPMPNDSRHLHFGGGQTEAIVTLSPGEHTLQLVLGDYLHIPHDPPLVSERITVTVTE